MNYAIINRVIFKTEVSESMVVYNINLGIGWASSGVEYAQAYRAELLRKINQPAKFIFTDLILNENIETFTKNIGFEDNEIIWLYQFFTDIKIAPSTYPLNKIEEKLTNKDYEVSTSQDNIIYKFDGGKQEIKCHFRDMTNKYIDRIEYYYDGSLMKREFYSYTCYAAEYLRNVDGQMKVYLRRFYNKDGSVAYEQLVDGQTEMYRLPDQILYSKVEFFEYFFKSLNLTADDTVIMDRSTDIGPVILRNHQPAKLVSVVHADHFAENSTTNDNILWNNFYEYEFDNADKFAAIISSTDAQTNLLREQFDKYTDKKPNLVTIPVGSLDKLRYPDHERNHYSLITASRLASEKHVDWLVEAVVQAKKEVPALTFDIYGQGGERQKLVELINKYQAQDYITLKGHHDLTETYKNYDAYIAASTSEGFGLSLMEAVGSGLAMVGFDVRYGNQTFIDDKENGYLLPYKVGMEREQVIESLRQAIVNLFKDNRIEKMHDNSYKLAKNYLSENVQGMWAKLLSWK